MKDYGKKWVGIEGYFSSIKRIFVDNLNSKTKNGLVHEVKMSFGAYQKMKMYGKAG